MTQKIILFTDGAARGNPGPAAIGIALTDERGNELEAFGETIGHATNNEAEYRALLRGLERAARHSNIIEIRTDSELLARQFERARTACARRICKPLHAQAQRALKQFTRADDCHHPARVESARGRAGERGVGWREKREEMRDGR
jgi:ribonuclease HI